MPRCRMVARPETVVIVETGHRQLALVFQGSTLPANSRRNQCPTAVSLVYHQMRKKTIGVSDCLMALVG